MTKRWQGTRSGLVKTDFLYEVEAETKEEARQMILNDQAEIVEETPQEVVDIYDQVKDLNRVD